MVGYVDGHVSVEAVYFGNPPGKSNPTPANLAGSVPSWGNGISYFANP